MNKRASFLVSALFTTTRQPTLSMDEATQALLYEQTVDKDQCESGFCSDSVVGENKELMLIVRELCDDYLCLWFRLSDKDCGNLRMQILMDVF